MAETRNPAANVEKFVKAVAAKILAQMRDQVDALERDARASKEQFEQLVAQMSEELGELRKLREELLELRDTLKQHEEMFQTFDALGGDTGEDGEAIDLSEIEAPSVAPAELAELKDKLAKVEREIGHATTAMENSNTALTAVERIDQAIDTLSGQIDAVSRAALDVQKRARFENALDPKEVYEKRWRAHVLKDIAAAANGAPPPPPRERVDDDDWA